MDSTTADSIKSESCVPSALPSANSCQASHKQGKKMDVPVVAVIIPCYRVSRHVLEVIARIGPEVSMVFAVDDACPDGSGRLIQAECRDARVRVLFHNENKGVGGAVITGYRAALAAGAEIMVKVDGDGQMDPALIPSFVAPIANGIADYTKGNRFSTVYAVRRMPAVRILGNSVLSFLTKLSSGYWTIFDPTNGYTAAHVAALWQIELRNLSNRYFFESDMLINLGSVRAVVMDIPMEAVYGDEKSGLKITSAIGEFLQKHIKEFCKRIIYNYFMRDFSLASLNFVLGLLLFWSGVLFGVVEWWRSVTTGVPASAGTVLLAALPVILGFQLLLSNCSRGWPVAFT